MAEVPSVFAPVGHCVGQDIVSIATGEEFELAAVFMRGLRARALFDRENMPVREQQIRHIIRKNNLWVR